MSFVVTTLVRTVAGAFVLAFLAVTGTATAQTAQPSRSGDWDTLCDTTPDTQQKICVLTQKLTMTGQHNVHFSVIVVKAGPVLRVLAPLGVLLETGVTLKVDGDQLSRMPFLRCLQNGCVAETNLDAALVRRLKAGKIATFVIYGQPDRPVDVPVSLNGFTRGYDALP